MTQTKDQQAQEYAEKKNRAMRKAWYEYRFGPIREYDDWENDPVKPSDNFEKGFMAGYTAAEQSMWRSVEVELPEEKKVVLCFMPDMKDNYAEDDAYFDIAILLEGEFINLDAETIHPTHWMPITPPSLPDTNTEKRYI